MDWQTIAVGLIIFAALLWTAKRIFAKAKSFSPKSGCGANCGCGDSKPERISTID